MKLSNSTKVKVKGIIRFVNQELKLVLILLFALSLFSYLTSCGKDKASSNTSNTDSIPCHANSDIAPITSPSDAIFIASMTRSPLRIDGCDKDSIWDHTDWYGMNYPWMGGAVDSSDYHGKFKLAWDRQYLYVLVEIVDEYLNPTLGNGIENYWKGDYVEVFIDEDQSGGNHQFNHQAFAYHVSTEGHAIDKNVSKETVFFDEHIHVERSQSGNIHHWEMAIQLFNDDFDEKDFFPKSVEITKQKVIGFSIAYGDNDGNNRRENFMGSKVTHGNNNDEGYINADVFGSLLFVE